MGVVKDDKEPRSEREPRAKKIRKDSSPSSAKEEVKENGTFENIKISVRKNNEEKTERVAKCKSANKSDDIRAFSDFLDKTKSGDEDEEQNKKPKKAKKDKKNKDKDK